jgi:hypothetical protein
LGLSLALFFERRIESIRQQAPSILSRLAGARQRNRGIDPKREQLLISIEAMGQPPQSGAGWL